MSEKIKLEAISRRKALSSGGPVNRQPLRPLQTRRNSSRIASISLCSSGAGRR
jgi:hypothetical protein